MELLTSRSRLVPSSESYAVNIPDTLVGLSDHFETDISPTTPCTDNVQMYTFNILPSVSSELYLPETELFMAIRLENLDGTQIDASTQVGILNFPGCFLWDSVSLR